MTTLRFRQHYTGVQIIRDGKLVVEMPWDAALRAAAALRHVGQRAEEWASAERIASDQALMIRAGAPIGLSNNPRIIAEATKQAQHDRDLRRYLPGGIKSKSIVGVPTIIQHEPKDRHGKT